MFYVSQAPPKVGSYYFFMNNISWLLSSLHRERLPLLSVPYFRDEGKGFPMWTHEYHSQHDLLDLSLLLFQCTLLLVVINPLAPSNPLPSNSSVAFPGPSWGLLKSCTSDPETKFLIVQSPHEAHKCKWWPCPGTLADGLIEKNSPSPLNCTMVNSFGGWMQLGSNPSFPTYLLCELRQVS